MGRLDGKVAIVTGAGRGIGREIALTLAREGAAVVVADIDEANGSKVAGEINSMGGKAIFVKTDVTSYENVGEMVRKAVDEFGGVDILVNNAAVWNIKLFKDSTPDDWMREIRINVIGVLNCIHNVLPHMMEKRGGRIVNIASDAGRVGEPWLTTYSGTKGYVISLTKALAKELGKYNITVNCVSPGVTKTPGAQKFIESVGEEKLAKAYPLRRLAEPKDIANAVLFFVLEESSYITGQILSVSGGYVVG